MKQVFKYLNDNKKSCVLGITNFDNFKVVAPSEVVTFEMNVEEDDVVFIKTWKHDDKILVSTGKKSVWGI